MVRGAIEAIPVVWHGVVFRSTLEARWAFVFERCGWAWTYEPEAIHLRGDKGRRYLPDFWIDDLDYVEIKPAAPTAREAMRCSLLARETGRLVWCIYGPPRDARATLYSAGCEPEHIEPPILLRCDGVGDGCPVYSLGETWCHAASESGDAAALLAEAAAASFEAAPNVDRGASLDWLLDEDLTEWETGFVESMQERLRKGWDLTERQEEVLDRIEDARGGR